MKKRTKRPSKARGVSLPEDLFDRVDQRLEQLQPRVKGFSHYIQLLVDWDLNGNGMDRKPFNGPESPLAGLAEAA